YFWIGDFVLDQAAVQARKYPDWFKVSMGCGASKADPVAQTINGRDNAKQAMINKPPQPPIKKTADDNGLMMPMIIVREPTKFVPPPQKPKSQTIQEEPPTYQSPVTTKIDPRSNQIVSDTPEKPPIVPSPETKVAVVPTQQTETKAPVVPAEETQMPKETEASADITPTQEIQKPMESQESKPVDNELKKSQPALNGSQPALNKSQPVLNKGQPALNNSQPVLNKSQPALNKSQPVLNKSQPDLKTQALPDPEPSNK
ncbi:hypothetical protein HDV02_005977, partial [Globomyces sp. JEL0801]